MSASVVPSPAEKKPIRKQNEGPLAELMRVLGAPSYTAMPPDQHEWQRHDIEGNTPLHRLWAWMVHNTLTWQHTTVDGDPKAYATSKEGVELHLEHAATDLKMDTANVRRTWREGEALGLWRRGTPEEGKRKLILKGKVSPPIGDSLEKKVCTDLLTFSPLNNLPPYVRDQILSRPIDDVKRIMHWYSRHAEVERVALADLMSAGRHVVGRLASEGWHSFGIEIRRLEPETDEQRQARLSPLLAGVEQLVTTVAAKVAEPPNAAELAILEAQVQRSVQTRNDSVRSLENGLHRVTGDTVQTKKNRASLSDLTTTKRGQRAGGRDISSSAAPSGSNRSHDGEEHGHLHTPQTSVLSSATESERLLFEKLLTEVAAVQNKHRKRFVGGVDPENKGDQAWALKVIRTVGPEEIAGFVPYVEHRATENALGRQVSVALIAEWAGDFRRGAADRERQRLAEIAMAEKRQAFNIQVEKNRAREQRIVDQVDQAWEQLSPAERKQMMTLARQELKVDPHWPGLTPEQKDDRAEVRVRMMLRRDIGAAAKRSGGAQ